MEGGRVMAKKRYWVTFDFSGYIWESTEVLADNKRQVRQIMRDHYGTNVKIHDIELEEEEQ
jgi:hypothetical protein